ncbi:MAG: IS110 family transposase [Thermoanaerobaculia bacterium]
MQTTAAPREYSEEKVLFLALELSNSKWKLGSTMSVGSKARERTIAAGDLGALHEEVSRAKRRFGLESSARVVSCYEAGRDGFWLDRHLRHAGIENIVVDPSSIEVNRRSRRAKTDRLDVGKLLRQLMRWWSGEPKVWGVARVPSVEAEDQRQLHRELEALKRERTRYTNRMTSLLVTQGIRLKVSRSFLARLSAVRLWDNSPVPAGLRSRLEREYVRWTLVQEQIAELEKQRRSALRTARDRGAQTARRLYRLRGIGENYAWLASMEAFAWRRFDNRRQVGGMAGLTPTPYSSGQIQRDQGIGKDGNRRLRAATVEIAWGWLRFQPDSELSKWFQERYGPGSRRSRRVGIVALARKLLIALWRYLETGVVPAGAVLKT